MTTILTTDPYPPATLRDQNNQKLATGEAYIDTATRFAEFFPSKTEDGDTLPKHASTLQITGGASYTVRHIRRCEAIRLGRTSPHYDIEIAA
jgi:hypothetical protein